MVKPNERSDLVVAAEAIEDDIRRLEELSATSRRIDLDGEKNIARAAQELARALQQQQHLADGLRGLGEAVVRMQGRQQAALEALGARALEIQARMARLSEHMQRFGALGLQASEVAKMLQGLPLLQGEARGAGQVVVEARVLIEVDERFTALVADARALAQVAHDEHFVEVAHQADVLEQQIRAMRGRLAQIVRAHAAGTS